MAEKKKPLSDASVSGGKGKEAVEGILEKLDINKGDNVAVEEPKETLDLESVDFLERLYALDVLFYGSELEAHFERLVPQQITLI